jgi:hypothetical protein
MDNIHTNYWRGRAVSSLAPSEAAKAANEAITELMKLREIDVQRENQQSLLVSFLAGACFCAAAVVVGILLH